MPKDVGDGHGYVALAREDIDDAKRRRPPGTLEAYAGEHGFSMPELTGRLGGWRAVMPRHPEYVFNLMVGSLGHGRAMILFHELLTLEQGQDGRLRGLGGEFWSVRTSSPVTMREALTPDAGDLPYVGWLFGGDPTDTGEPFGVAGAWAPTTSIATIVPETVATLPFLRIGQKGRMPLLTGRKLDEFGHPEWRLVVPEEFPEELVGEVVGGGLGDLLRAHAADGYAAIALERGLLKLRRNGYLMDPAALDAFSAQFAAAAEHLQRFGLARAEPVSFETALAPARWKEPPQEEKRRKLFGFSLPSVSVGSGALPKLGRWWPSAPWPPAFRKLADRMSLELEDSEAFHLAFPSLPIHGVAIAVLRGRLPGSETTGRLLYLAEDDYTQSKQVRAAIVFPAPGVPDGPVGGIRDRERQAVLDVQDGIAVCWSLRTADVVLGEEGESVARLLACSRANGLAC